MAPRKVKQHIDWSAVKQYWADRKVEWEFEMQLITSKHLPHFTGEAFNAAPGSRAL